LINNRQNGRRRGRGGQQARNGQPGGPNGGNRLDNRARGNAAQLLEKYKTLARDAQMQGDRVNTEYYLQFADHYFRVLAENRSRFEEQRPRPQGDFREEYGDEGDGEGANEGQGRGYERRSEGDDASDGWDDAGDQAPRQDYRPRREEREPREARGDREPRADREARGEREPRTEREPRAEREPRESRAERPYRNGKGANGNHAAADELPVEALPLPPRIQLDRLPPATAESEEEAPAVVAEEAPRPRTRRPRKPKEPAAVEA